MDLTILRCLHENVCSEVNYYLQNDLRDQVELPFSGTLKDSTDSSLKFSRFDVSAVDHLSSTKNLLEKKIFIILYSPERETAYWFNSFTLQNLP